MAVPGQPGPKAPQGSLRKFQKVAKDIAHVQKSADTDDARVPGVDEIRQEDGHLKLENVVSTVVQDVVKHTLKYGADQTFNISSWLKKHGKAERQELTKLQMAQLRECFELVDADGSGAIDTKEMRECFKLLGLKLSWAKLKELIQEIDTDGSGEIEYHEFVDLMTRAWQLASGSASAQIGGSDFQSAASSYRRTRLLQSIVQNKAGETRQMVLKCMTYKEKELELKRKVIEAAACKFDERESRRRQQKAPEYGEYEVHVESTLLPEALRSHDLLDADDSRHSLPPIVSRSAPGLLEIKVRREAPAFGRKRSTEGPQRIRVRKSKLHLEETPSPLYLEDSCASLPLTCRARGDDEVVFMSDLRIDPKTVRVADLWGASERLASSHKAGTSDGPAQHAGGEAKMGRQGDGASSHSPMSPSADRPETYSCGMQQTTRGKLLFPPVREESSARREEVSPAAEAMKPIAGPTSTHVSQVSRRDGRRGRAARSCAAPGFVHGDHSKFGERCSFEPQPPQSSPKRRAQSYSHALSSFSPAASALARAGGCCLGPVPELPFRRAQMNNPTPSQQGSKEPGKLAAPACTGRLKPAGKGNHADPQPMESLSITQCAQQK